MLPNDHFKNNGQPAAASALDEELMMCKICLKNYEMNERHPKELNCQHVFCNGCINKYLLKSKNKKDKKVRCPLCREMTRCGSGDSNALKTSEYSEGLVRLFQGLIAQRERKMMGRGLSLDSGMASRKDVKKDDDYDDVDEYGVEASRKVVVKSVNPLLHPTRMWSKLNWGGDDDDDDDDDGGNKNGGEPNNTSRIQRDDAEANSFKNSPAKTNDESVRPYNNNNNHHARKSVKDVWKEEKKEEGEEEAGPLYNNNNNHLIISDVILEDCEDTMITGDETTTDSRGLVYAFLSETVRTVQREIRPVQDGVHQAETHPVGGLATSPQIEFSSNPSVGSSIESPSSYSSCQMASPFPTCYHRSISIPTTASSQLSADDDNNNEDLDWNYFTKTSTLGSPKSTMKISPAALSSPDDNDNKRRSLNDIITNSEVPHHVTETTTTHSGADVPKVHQPSTSPLGYQPQQATQSMPQQQQPAEFESLGINTKATTHYSAATVPEVVHQSSTSSPLSYQPQQVIQPMSQQQQQPAEFGSGKLVSPRRVKASWDGDKILVIDDSNAEGNVQIFSSNKGELIASFHVYGTLSDACILDSSQKSARDQTRLAAATSVGVEIYETGSPVAVKTIPIGPASRVAEFKDGFVVQQQQSSLSVCPNMKCNLVLHSIKLAGIISTTTTYAHTQTTELLDVATCREKPDVIGLLTKHTIFLIDQTGNILETIALNASDYGISTSPSSSQISFASNARSIVLINPNNEKIEIHDILLFSGSKKSFDFPLSSLAHGEKVLSGTMVGPDRIFLIQLGTRGTKLYSYKIA